MFDQDCARAVSECRNAFPWFVDLDDKRQNVVASMVFNIGLRGFKGFKKAIAAIGARDWNQAADQMLSSKWAGQVGSRASRLAQMMRDGETVH